MGRLRFTIVGLMAVVLVAAVGFASLRSGSEWWATALFTAAILVVLGSAIGAIARRGRDRLPWVGSTVFGSVYLVLAFGPWFSTEVRPHLVTTTAIDCLFRNLHGYDAPAMMRAPAMLHVFDQGNQYEVDSDETLWRRQAAADYPALQRIGHSLAAILCALLGAITARIVSPRIASEVGNQDRDGASR